MSRTIPSAIVPSAALPRGISRSYPSLALLLTGLLSLSGCATPIFPKELTEQAKFQPSFFSLSMDPDAYKGTTVIYGGTIIRTSNLKDYTEVEVLQKELDSDYAPQGLAAANGRFLARCMQFLDPEIYKPGRDVTVAGQVQGKEPRMVGEVAYSYPVISCQNIKVWYEEIDYYYYPYPAYGWGGYWGYGGWGGYGWYDWPYYYGPVVRKRAR